MTRNLNEDLRICEQASPGPWEIADTTDGYVLLDADGHVLAFLDSIGRADDARFIAEARTGWLEAIQRAMDAEERLKAAEADVEWLRSIIETVHGMAYEHLSDDHEITAYLDEVNPDD